MKEIIISGYYGFHNNGDDALLKAIVNDLEDRGLKDKVVVLSANAEETAKVYGVRAINRYNYIQIAKYMKQASLLIFGGGTLLQDGTSTKSLLYYLSIIRLALCYGLKTMVYANGIGPLGRKYNRSITARLLQRVDFITLRDGASYDFIRDLGVVHKRVELTADPVFNLEPSPDIVGKGILRLANVGEHSRVMGISVRDWDGLTPGFFSIVQEAALYAKKKYNLCPVLIPMQPEQDIYACKKVMTGHEDVFSVIDGSVSVQDMLSVIKQMDLIIGMRLHTLIYSAVAGVPLIGLVYDPKVSGFMQYVHQDKFINVENVTVDALKTMIDECMQNYHSISNGLKDLAFEMRKRCIKNGDIAQELYSKEPTIEK